MKRICSYGMAGLAFWLCSRALAGESDPGGSAARDLWMRQAHRDAALLVGPGAVGQAALPARAERFQRLRAHVNEELRVVASVSLREAERSARRERLRRRICEEIEITTRTGDGVTETKPVLRRDGASDAADGGMPERVTSADEPSANTISRLRLNTGSPLRRRLIERNAARLGTSGGESIRSGAEDSTSSNIAETPSTGDTDRNNTAPRTTP
jgi:hypothetical protein